MTRRLRNRLRAARLLAALGFAAPTFAAAQAGPVPEYHNKRFDIDGVKCVHEPTAVCTVNVLAKVQSLWDLDPKNALMTREGVRIPVRTISVGGRTVSIPASTREGTVTLEPGIKTKITMDYGQRVNPCDIAALILYVGHWTARTVPMVADFPQARCSGGR